MTAASTSEWLAAFGLAVGGYLPWAVTVVALDHPRLQRAVLLPIAALQLALTPTTLKETDR